MTTQWDPNGYFYSTQIAQFGLEYFSKSNFGELFTIPFDNHNSVVFFDQDEFQQFGLDSSKTLIEIEKTNCENSDNLVLDVTTKSPKINLQLEYEILPCSAHKSSFCNAQLRSFTHENGELAGMISVKLFNNGNAPSKHFRLIQNDIEKFLNILKPGLDYKNLKIESINSMVVDKNGRLNVKFHSRPDLQLFWNAVKWFQDNYDENGGYPVNTVRKVAGYRNLPKGWYGAMAQGQAMSVISRAHHLNPEPAYIDTLIEIMKPFDVHAANGGVKNSVFGFTWYEEYPMQPNGQFVLNGFMYSLVGLFDALQACSVLDTNENICADKARSLLQDGLVSLYNVAPFYDNGFGTFYDLRHVFSTAEPNRARWDYHTVHITLMRFFASVLSQDNHIEMIDLGVEDTELYRSRFEKLAARWTKYSDGEYAKHN